MWIILALQKFNVHVKKLFLEKINNYGFEPAT